MIVGDYTSRVCATIDLSALRFNLESMKKNLQPGCRLVGVIKANGYGHGSVELARVMEEIDYVAGYATATFEEARALRDAGMKKPILVLGFTFPYSYEEMIKLNIRPAIFKPDQVEAFSETVMSLIERGELPADFKAPVHVKVDTGMSRIGITPDDAGLGFVEKLSKLDGIDIEGIFTHFAKADMNPLDDAKGQAEKLATFIRRIEEELKLDIRIKHCCNSAGIIRMQDYNWDLCRAGITLYGLWPSDEVEKDIVPLKPLMSLTSHIAYIKDLEPGHGISYGGTYVTKETIRVATIPVGYADGYPRTLSGKGHVLICGKKAPILGRVCMDQMMVDVTDIPEAGEGAEVVLMGCQGNEQITAEYLGDLSGRFNYELVCDITARVPRVYVE